MERGLYESVAVVDENEDTTSYRLEGCYIDLFDPKLPVLTHRVVASGTQALLSNLDMVEYPSHPQVLACASCVEHEQRSGSYYSFEIKGPVRTTNCMRVLLPKKPVSLTFECRTGDPQGRSEWDAVSKTCLIICENSPEGVRVSIEF